MKRYIFLSILFTMFAVLVAACGKDANKAANEEQVELARKAVGVVGANSLWRCAGKTGRTFNEYLAATLQQDPTNNDYILVVSQITVTGKDTYSQNGLILQKVSINKVVGNPNMEEYFASRGPTPNPAMTAALPIGTYDYKQEQAYFPTIQLTGNPATIDCKEARVK